MSLQGLRKMLTYLAPVAQQRALVAQVSDLQADRVGNEVSWKIGSEARLEVGGFHALRSSAEGHAICT
jgi:hypothetical protein